MSGNGPFGALADGFMQGAAMRDSRKQRKLDEEMARMAAADRARQLELQAEMQAQQIAGMLQKRTLDDLIGKDALTNSAFQRSDSDRRFGAGQANSAAQLAFQREELQARQASQGAALQQRGREAAFAGVRDDIQNMAGIGLRSAQQQRIEAETARLNRPRDTNPFANGYEQTQIEDPFGNPTIRRVPIGPAASPLPGRMGSMPAGIQQQYQQTMPPAPAGAPAAVGGVNTVRIRTPQGAFKLIDKAMLQQAIQQGATLAQ